MNSLPNIFFFVVLSLNVHCLYSQVASVRDREGNILNLHQIKITPVIDEINFEGVDPNVNKLKYAEIKGSPFWSDEWMSAILYSGEKAQAIVTARNNLATGQIHFRKNQEEYVIANTLIDRVVFVQEQDSTTFIKHPHLFIKKKPLKGFVEVMNDGRFQLLKYTHRTITESDSLFGTRRRYFFKDDIYYFLKCGEKVDAIKKLDQENVLLSMPSAKAHGEWLGANRINFRKEQDVILFLKYCNLKLIK